MTSEDSSVKFLPTGAIIQELNIAGHNIVLGYPSVDPYVDAPFFGETIGRVANRTKDAQIDLLNGKSYRLAANNGPNHLHGGLEGWGKKKFSGPKPENRNGKEAVLFSYVSPDGEEGYPGTVELKVWYTASIEAEDGVSKFVLETEYEVQLVDDDADETVINVTNHSYFNIANGPTIDGTEVRLSTSKYLAVVDENLIPTGTIEDFPGVEADTPIKLGETGPVFDHAFVVDTDTSNIPLDTRKGPLRKLAGFSHAGTALHIDFFSTEPAFQFYTGEHINAKAAAETPARGPRAGFCIEPSRFINAVNVPEWRNQVVLKKGATWGARTVYKAWKA
ncbi:hypothetical protein B0A52_00616 [Exophiala mesophila]|uniref:Aldose 1-epimerase n=1 Tax=Exophiala mesophila TaxID=212818 RepID=A0A438NHR4_EXOME|nr:hypothetical protein B0A52_00616 [Exophiala mesophila]